MELNLALLGDLRLASILAGHEATDGLHAVAEGFLRTLCNDALLDEPRGVPSQEEGAAEREGPATRLEVEVSEALLACEVPHDGAGRRISGALFALTSHATQAVFCTEEVAVGTVYANAPAQRSAWQQWRCRAAAAAGWRVFTVSEAEWKKLGGPDERVEHMRQILLNPLDVKAL